MRASLSCIARLSAVLVVLGFAQSLHASTINFSYSGVGVSGSGTLTATFDGGDTYTVTAISGTQTGTNPGTIDLLAIQTYGNNDNDVITSAPYLDFAGLGFKVGTTDYNIYNNILVSPAQVYLCDSATQTSCGDAQQGAAAQFSLRGPRPHPSQAR